MNSKHAACFFLGCIMALLGYGTMVMHRKLSDMREQESAAKQSYDLAQLGRQNEQSKLLKKKRQTEGIREYLKTWLPHFEQTSTEVKAERLFAVRVKQGDLVALNKSTTPVKLEDKENTINSVLRAELIFEDDYRKALEWFSGLEGGVPASRVTNYVVSKGQRGDEIKMELTVDFPLLATNTPAQPQP